MPVPHNKRLTSGNIETKVVINKSKNQGNNMSNTLCKSAVSNYVNQT